MCQLFAMDSEWSVWAFALSRYCDAFMSAVVCHIFYAQYTELVLL